MIRKIAEKMLLWGMDARYIGTIALLYCANDAAMLTLDGEPWSMKKLCVRYAQKHDCSWKSVSLAMEDALAAAGVHQTNKGAICALVGYALRSKNSINTPEGWNSLVEKVGATVEN